MRRDNEGYSCTKISFEVNCWGRKRFRFTLEITLVDERTSWLIFSSILHFVFLEIHEPKQTTSFSREIYLLWTEASFQRTIQPLCSYFYEILSRYTSNLKWNNCMKSIIAIIEASKMSVECVRRTDTRPTLFHVKQITYNVLCINNIRT